MPSISPKNKSFEENINAKEEQELPQEYGRGGYLYVRIGDTFCDGRYEAIRKLGWGTFSTVWLCTDNKFKDYVALKIAKAKTTFCETAVQEIKILTQIQRSDLHHSYAYRIVKLVNHFTIKKDDQVHYCLAFEVMGHSLYKFQFLYYQKGIPLEIVKPIVRQVLEGLCYLHTKCGFIHSDIKPENILLTVDNQRIRRMHSEVKYLIGVCGESNLPESFISMANTDNRRHSEFKDKNWNQLMDQNSFDDDFNEISVKIADLGNASHVNDLNDSIIQTRPYRSPEVILGSRYDTSADIWSTACMTFELLTGDLLFDFETSKQFCKNVNQLREMIELLGPLPINCRKGKNYNKYFTKSGRLYGHRTIRRFTLEEVLQQNYKWEPQVSKSFAQFLLPMLRIDPKKRVTASDCLDNQWLYS